MKKILLMAFLVLASSGGMLAQSKKSVRVKQQTESTKTKTPAKSSRKMVKKGMVVRDVDKQPFIDAVQPVYEKLGYAATRKAILAELAK